MSFHEQLQEKHLCLETMQGLYKYTQRIIFAAVSTSLWAALLRILTQLVECAHSS